ncbi:C-X-C chemokine receptor type 2-like [Polyodon spathula]|uniref:C-X-C chemokine receptor type 2-like n=1 Tax=Polyodon spathula TaxID=7913 RepID=UPI001B7E0901|nr:C-X-C chemokine receptor type 2-like [Polyodon spathula]
MSEDISYSFAIDDLDLSDFENISATYDPTFILDPKTITCQPLHIDPAVNSVICAIYALIFLLAVPGNIIVGIVIGCNHRLLSPSDIYLLNLAVADTLFAVTIPFWAVSTIHEWIFGDVICKVVSLVQEVNFYSSILFLAVISVDRYLAIVQAVQMRKQRQPFYSWLACASVWVVGALLSLPVLFHSAFKPSNSKKTVCYEEYDPETAAEWRFATRLLRHSLGFLLPLTIMMVCYGITICRLLQKRSFEKQKAMKVIVAVVLAFLICWMPYHLVIIGDTLIRFKLVSYTCEVRNSISLGIFITQSLGLLHSCINPILYAFVGEKFRRNSLKLLHKWRLVERDSKSMFSRSTSNSSETNNMMI